MAQALSKRTKWSTFKWTACIWRLRWRGFASGRWKNWMLWRWHILFFPSYGYGCQAEAIPLLPLPPPSRCWSSPIPFFPFSLYSKVRHFILTVGCGFYNGNTTVVMRYVPVIIHIRGCYVNLQYDATVVKCSYTCDVPLNETMKYLTPESCTPQTSSSLLMHKKFIQ